MAENGRKKVHRDYLVGNGFPRIIRHSPTTVTVLSFEFVIMFVVSTLLNIALASLGRNSTVIEVMVGFLYLYGLIQVNEPLVGEP